MTKKKVEEVFVEEAPVEEAPVEEVEANAAGATLRAVEAVAGQWDTDLDEVRVDENNVIRGLKCGIFKPQDLVDGDTYYKIIGAAFIDEEEAAGRHIITVDVVDENFNRIQGAKVWHGWPAWTWDKDHGPIQVFPEYDERVVTTIFGSQLAEWALYGSFDAWKVPGPYWIQSADGKSDAFFGAGLPWARHVCFAVTIQRTIYRAAPTGTFKQRLIAEAARRQVIQFNPDAALQKRIFPDGFVPNSDEFELEGNIAQRAESLRTGEVRVYYAPLTNVNDVTFVRDGG